MSLEAKLYTLLSPLVGGRVFPDAAPFDTQRPYITYQQIGGRVITPLNKSIPNVQNAGVQINCWDNTRIASKTLALLIEDAMRTTDVFQATPESAPHANHEEDLGLYGFDQDFSVWYER